MQQEVVELKKNLKETEEIKPANWLGKWWKSIRTKAIKNRIDTLEKDLKDKKNGTNNTKAGRG